MVFRAWTRCFDLDADQQMQIIASKTMHIAVEIRIGAESVLIKVNILSG